MAPVFIPGQKAVSCAAACERSACAWLFVFIASSRGGKEKTGAAADGPLALQHLFMSGEGKRAVSQPWQVAVPWQRLVPGAQRAEASPSSRAAGLVPSAIQPPPFREGKMGSGPWSRC